MKRDIVLFKISCLLMGISSFSILLSFFGDYKGNSIAVIFAVLTGVLFWAGLIFGLFFLLLVNSHRKKYESIESSKRTVKRHRMGIVSFFSNKLAIIADIAMVALFIIFLVTEFIPIISQSVTLIFLAFLLFSVYMHCMLNGVNFIYIKSICEECKK